VSTPSDGAILLIKIPDDGQTGSYEIKITATNSIGSTQSVTYAFDVTD